MNKILIILDKSQILWIVIPVSFFSFRQLQQLGKGYRTVVTIHWQIENEAAKCHMKSETKTIEEQKNKLSEPLELFWSVPSRISTESLFIWWYKQGVCMYFRGLPVLWSIEADQVGGDELFISSMNLFVMHFFLDLHVQYIV